MLTFLQHRPMDGSKRYHIFKPFQLPCDQGSMSPRACKTDIEMVTISLGWEFCTSFGRYIVAEDGWLAFELASVVFRIHPIKDVGLVAVCLCGVRLVEIIKHGVAGQVSRTDMAFIWLERYPVWLKRWFCMF